MTSLSQKIPQDNKLKHASNQDENASAKKSGEKTFVFASAAAVSNYQCASHLSDSGKIWEYLEDATVSQMHAFKCQAVLWQTHTRAYDSGYSAVHCH